MALAIYVKEKPRVIRKGLSNKYDRIFFVIISLVGLSAVIFAAWPLLVWNLTTLPRLTAGVDFAPIPKSEVLSTKSSLEENVQVIKDPDGFSYFAPTTFSKGEGQNKSSYLAPTDLSKIQKNRPSEFYLSIPKLKIVKAKVKVDSLNFKSSLAHFPNSALPGEVGNSFITGHSVLPQFYDPDNYLTIFTKLSDLEIGDDIIIQLADDKIHFTVQYLKIVDPHDLSVLSKISPNGRNLTLMSCVPPGANTKRLVVVTSLL